MACRSCKEEPPRSGWDVINHLAGWIPALHPLDKGVRERCPKCGNRSVVAVKGGGIECKGGWPWNKCGYSKPSPYSGPPGLWASAAREASGSFWGLIGASFLMLVILVLSTCFFGSMLFVGYNGAAIGGGVSFLVLALLLSPFLVLYWGHYRDASRRAKQLWSGMDDLDHDAARYIRAEMEQDLGF